MWAVLELAPCTIGRLRLRYETLWPPLSMGWLPIRTGLVHASSV